MDACCGARRKDKQRLVIDFPDGNQQSLTLCGRPRTASRRRSDDGAYVDASLTNGTSYVQKDPLPQLKAPERGSLNGLSSMLASYL
jgi:hypothetical protein